MYARVCVCVYVCVYTCVCVYKTRLASNEIFSPSNKIHQGLGQAKDLLSLLLTLPPVCVCVSNIPPKMPLI